MGKIEFILAEERDIKLVENISKETIEEIYPKYYPRGVVDFFLDLHSFNNIKRSIKDELIILIKVNSKIIGTGSLKGNEIQRMFILPEYQKKGYGNALINELENRASDLGYTYVELCSSLPGYDLYLKRGYEFKEYKKRITENNDILCYTDMIKKINNRNEYKINYNNRVFVTKENTSNGEVSDDTKFLYHQDGSIIWAEYSGGDLVKGYLLGNTDEEGNLRFSYQHINIYNDLRMGECNSSPEILSNGKLRMHEKWKWTNGDKSEGESIIEEI